MSLTHPRKIFVNLPVRDLDRSVAFFTELGFEFNPRFTDGNATSMILSDEAYVMLLVDDFFKTFTSKSICDSATHVEAIFALSADSRAEVDEMVSRAIAAGGSAAAETSDQGFMYGGSFHDPDGHLWEVMWMDPAAMPHEPPEV